MRRLRLLLGLLAAFLAGWWARETWREAHALNVSLVEATATTVDLFRRAAAPFGGPFCSLCGERFTAERPLHVHPAGPPPGDAA